MNAPKAILFDLDGVLTDTSEYHYQAWKHLADDESIPFTHEENDAHLRGVGRRDSLLYLLKGRKVSEAHMLPPSFPARKYVKRTPLLFSQRAATRWSYQRST